MFAGNLWILAQALTRRTSAYPETVIASVSEVPVGGVKLFSYPEPQDLCILVRTEPDQFVAYSQKCTHLSCPVYYSAKTTNLECPCHQGSFSVKTGDVIAGPPKRPLPRILLKRQGENLIATAVVAGAE
jgi:Rieske Fe-S protein